MRSLVVIAILVMLLAVTMCGMSRSSAVPVGVPHARADVEERFAVRYCYRQYNNQTDINDCLRRTVHLSRRNH